MNTQTCVPCEPTQQLNDIAGEIIDILSCAHSTVNVVIDRLFGTNEANAIRDTKEPCNLESRLNLIRSMAQELENKICVIQNRV